MALDWDEANTDHIAWHGIDPEEAEEALGDPDATPAHTYRGPGGERRSAIIGKTENGRFLFVVFTFQGGLLRVVTARDATPNEKRRYRRL